MEVKKIKAASTYVKLLDDVINSDCFRDLISESVKLSQMDAYGGTWETKFKDKYSRLQTSLNTFRTKNVYGVSLAEYKGFGSVDLTSMLSFIMEANEDSFAAREEEIELDKKPSGRIKNINEEFAHTFLKSEDKRKFYDALKEIKDCRNIVSHRNASDYTALAENPEKMHKQAAAIKLVVSVIRKGAESYSPVTECIAEMNKKDVVTGTSITTKIENLVDISNGRYCFYDDLVSELKARHVKIDPVQALKGQPYLTIYGDMVIGSTLPLLVGLFCSETAMSKLLPEEAEQVKAPKKKSPIGKIVLIIALLIAVIVAVDALSKKASVSVLSEKVTEATLEHETEARLYEIDETSGTADITNLRPESSEGFETEYGHEVTVGGEDWSKAAVAYTNSGTGAYADYYVDDIFDYISLEIAPHDNFYPEAVVVLRILDADTGEILAESDPVCKASKKQKLFAVTTGHNNIRLHILKFGGGNGYLFINNILLHKSKPDDYTEPSGEMRSDASRRNLTYEEPESMNNFLHDTTARTKDSLKWEPAFISSIQYGDSGYFDLYLGGEYDTISLHTGPDPTRQFSENASCIVEIVDPDTEEAIATSDTITSDSHETTLTGSVKGLDYVRITIKSEGHGWDEAYVKDIIAKK